MATEILKYADAAGNIYDTEAEADAADSVMEAMDEINTFVAKYYPAKDGVTRTSPRNTMIKNALIKWVGEKGI